MIELKIYSGSSEEVINEIHIIQSKIFPTPYPLEKIKDRIHNNKNFISVHAYNNKELVGFKSGYAIDPETFYSWLGGIETSFRCRGIAKQLMDAQHLEAKKQGFSRVQTRTQNRFREMLILNLKCGFEITKTFHDDRGLQIVLEKEL